MTTILNTATKLNYHIADKRSFGKVQYCIAWSPSAPSPFMSADYTHQLPHSKTYIEANKPIWERISNQIRFLDPDMYLQRSVPGRMYPPNINPLSVAFQTLCLN